MPELAADKAGGDSHSALGQRAVARLCSLLLGLSGGVYLAGLVARFQSLFDPLPRTSATVISVSLICGALGPWLPQRVVSRFLDLLVRQARGPGRVSVGQTSAILRGQDAAKRRAWWLVGAILFLAAGAGMVLSLVLLDWLGVVYGWVLDRMLLTVPTLRAVEWLVVLVVAGPVGLLAGLTVASLHAHYLNAGQPGRSRSLALGILAGAALSLPAAYELVLPYGSASHAMLLGAAGFFLAAVLCMVVAIRVEKATIARERVPRFSPPESAGRLHGLILSGLLCWGLWFGLSAGVWWRVGSYERAAGVCLESSFLSGWLLWMAAGVAAAGLIAPTRRHSPEGCGIALWIAGLASVGVVGLLSLAGPDVALRMPVVGLMAVRPTTAASVVSGFFGGMALPYAKRALMVQCGGQPVIYAELISAILTGIGVGLWLAAAWLMGWLGVSGAQCLAGLACMVAGGILVVHEKAVGGMATWLRSSLVLGSLAVLLGLVPGWVRQASSAEDGLAEALRGRSWSVKPLSRLSSDALPVVLAAASPHPASARRETPGASSPTEQLLACLGPGHLGGRACVIGGQIGPAKAWESVGFRYLEHWPHDGRALNTSAGLQAEGPAGGQGRLKMIDGQTPALGAWRAWRGPFDLVILWPVDAGSVQNASIWTAETFVALRRCLGPGGRLVVALPAGDLDAATLSVIAAGFRAALHGRAAWRVYPSGNDMEQIWLLGARLPAALGKPGLEGPAGWRPLNEIAPAQGPFPLHSLQTPRVRLGLARGPARQRQWASLRALVSPGTPVR